MDYVKALQELQNHPSALSKYIWENWLRKYQHIIKELLQKSNGIPYLIYNLGNSNTLIEFYRVFLRLTELMEIVKYEPECKKILEEYKQALAKEKYQKENNELINWALKYKTYFLQYFDISPLYHQHLILSENGNTYQLNISDFEHIIVFGEIYSKLFYEDKILPEMLNDYLSNSNLSQEDYY